MDRKIVIVGAPSSIGIRPYDHGGVRRLDLAPRALREQGLVERLSARDAGDVLPPPYRDFVRPPGRVRNEASVLDYSRALGDRIAEASANDEFVVLLGGDCSVVLGGLLGVRRRNGAPVGLAYVDAHADFATPEVSRTGSAASMCLGLAVGRGDTPLARLRGADPLVQLEDVVVIGRRDDADEPWYGQDVLRKSPMLDLPHATVRVRGTTATAHAALERLTQPQLRGFWIHIDADVLDPSVMPAVDSPEPGGLTFDELADIIAPLARHPSALGLELTIYDPTLDPDSRGAHQLVSLLHRLLGPEVLP
ncbi:MAG TPA: arginase family protein [Longimicrobiales bacterium]|nr:arginase family protein [Longimicrobiales bacterium]